MPLEERDLRRWVRAVAEGKASRRQFMGALLGWGLSGPFAAHLLATQTPAAAAGGPLTPVGFTPTTRGGGGRLRLLWWQAPTMLNAHLSSGLKDIDAARVVYEPLAAFNQHGQFVPILAREIPSFANGATADDQNLVLWRWGPDLPHQVMVYDPTGKLPKNQLSWT